jgi:hypothetical protein
MLLLLSLCLISVPLALDKLHLWNGFVEYLRIIIMFLVTVKVDLHPGPFGHQRLPHREFA